MTNDPPHGQQMSSRTRVRVLAPDATPIPSQQGVLDDHEPQPVGPFSEFVAADAPFTLELEGAAPPSEAAAPVAVVDHTVEREEAGEFGYVLLHEVYTPDGVVYEVTLPIQQDQGVLADDDEVTTGPDTTLRFPLRRFMDGTGQGVRPSVRDSGVLRDDDDEEGGSSPLQHVVRIIKAPITGALDALIAKSEPQPTPLRIADDGSLQPLANDGAWRGLFADPAREQRVLLYVHGFLSESNASLPRRWLPWLRSRYDALVAYTHPTISKSPLTNVTDLLERIPPDLRLKVDVLAHSRGGLVARSLVELAPQAPQIAIEKVLTCGTPHNGTPLARREQWERLASIVLTASSWLLAGAGAGLTVRLLPRLVEQILKAGSKHFFTLPGVNALVPGNDFLQQLNTANTPPIMAERRYAAVTSTFETESILEGGFKQALGVLAAQVFIGLPNDLVIPTDSMSAIDALTVPFAGRRHSAGVNHYGYFDDSAIEGFAQEFLRD